MAARYVGADGKCCCALQNVLLRLRLYVAWQHDADTNAPLLPWRIGWGIAVYHMLRQHQPYRDYRTTVPGQHAEQQLVKKLQQRVERLGYQVQLLPIAAAQPPS